MEHGKVYIVGAGPGDPDLITVKGLRAIKEADVILYDRLINGELLTYAKPGAEQIFCGKQPNFHVLKQETINQLLVHHALKGKIVTRLKGGDPFVFGRGGEEAEHLAKHHIVYEIIPGITSGIAAPAYAGIPVTHQEYSQSFAIITGHQCHENGDIQWESLAKGIDTLAIYMGVKKLPYICEQLMKHGRHPDTPVALVYWGTTENQLKVTGTLETIVQEARKSHIQNPSIIIIGDVVKLSETLNWFQPKPNEQQQVLRAVL